MMQLMHLSGCHQTTLIPSANTPMFLPIKSLLTITSASGHFSIPHLHISISCVFKASPNPNTETPRINKLLKTTI